MRIQRVYNAGPKRPGETRVLVDRIWPRGIRKEALELDGWFRELAPSNELRRWFGHEPGRWTEFRTRYRAELARNEEGIEALAALARRSSLVLLYSARDEERNQAVVLGELIGERL